MLRRGGSSVTVRACAVALIALVVLSASSGCGAKTRQVTRDEPVPYAETTRENAQAYEGEESVVQTGVVGLARVLYEQTVDMNGLVVAEREVSRTVVTPAVDQITESGVRRMRVAYVKNESEIWVMDPDGANAHQVYKCDRRPYILVAIPQRPIVGFLRSESADESADGTKYSLILLNVDTGTTQVVSEVYTDASHSIFDVDKRLFIAPDGRTVYWEDDVYVTRKYWGDLTTTGARELWAYDIDSDVKRRVLTGSVDGSDPTYIFSPDAQRVAFVDADQAIHVCSVNGENLVVTPRIAGRPASFSSDGATLYLMLDNAINTAVDVAPDNKLSNQHKVKVRISASDRAVIPGTSLYKSSRSVYRLLSAGDELIADLPVAGVTTRWGVLASGRHVSADHINGNYDVYVDGQQVTNDLAQEESPVWVW